jgi:hypothetical protein
VQHKVLSFIGNHKVGDLSLKGHVGITDFALVSSRQPNFETVGNNKLPALNKGKSANADAMFQRNIAYL